jgi:hypothetical protein
LLGGNSEWEPPDPISNSEVKTLCADGSVPFGHARVGHCQAFNLDASAIEASMKTESPAAVAAGLFPQV